MPALARDALVRDVARPCCGLRALLARNVARAGQVARLLLGGKSMCTPCEGKATYRRIRVPLVNVGGGPKGKLVLSKA